MTTRGRWVLVAVVTAAAAGAALLLLPAGARSGPAMQASTERHTIRVAVSAAVVGTSTVQIDVSDAAGVTGVRVEPAMTQMGHAFAPLTAQPRDEPGRYRVDVDFAMPGPWELTVVVDDGQGTQRVVFPLVVTG